MSVDILINNIHLQFTGSELTTKARVNTAEIVNHLIA